ncbi:MAG: ARMT1-like domain-containing protein [Firmicutes bacterium]|nr:ARMT1-like domain-containing protein [Bacillota bacterium]
MSVNLDAQCLQCHLRRNVETARTLGTEEQATAFAKDLMRLYLSMPAQTSSPELSPGTTALFREHYGLDADRFRAEKQASNAFVLERMDAIRSRVEAAEDPVYAGLQFAVLGNYIDFSALQGEVSFDTLAEMLAQGEKISLDREVYGALCGQLAQARRLLYLTDNAGEIGFDRICAEEIRRRFPQLQITFCVRGGPAMNDATREDAAAVALPFPVIDNGNTVPGTALPLLGAQARRAMEQADVILSKGQGNAETLLGCGYNIYYAFLVKCDRFIRLFGKPKLTPMLVRERSGW